MDNQMMLLFFGGVIIILGLVVLILRTNKPKKTTKNEPVVVDITTEAAPLQPAASHDAGQTPEAKEEGEPCATQTQTQTQTQTEVASASVAHHGAAAPINASEKSQLDAATMEISLQVLTEEEQMAAAQRAEEQTSEEHWQKTLKAMFKRRIQAHTLEKNANQQSQSMRQASSTLVVYLMAKRSKPYSGKALLTLFAKHGFVYNTKSQLFHRLDDAKTVLFQICQAKKPGVFTLTTMQQQTTEGLAFLLDIQQLNNPKATFKTMLAMIHDISKKLGGDMLDDHKNRLTESSVCMYLAKIKGLEAYRKTEHVD